MAARSSRASAPKRPFRDQKRQTRLQFSSLPSSPPAQASSSPDIPNRLAGVPPRPDEPSPEPSCPPTLELPPELQRSTQQRAEMPPHTSFPSSPTINRVRQIDLADESGEDELISPAQKKRKPSPLESVQPSSIPPRRKSRRLNADFSSPVRQVSISGEDAGAGFPSSPPPRSSGRLRRRPSPRPSRSMRSGSPHTGQSVRISSPVNRCATFSDLGSPETSGDDDPVMVTKPSSRRKSRLDKDDPFTVNNDELQYLSDQESHRRPTPKRKKSRGDNFVVDDDEVEYLSSSNESDEVRVQPLTKSRKLSNRKPSKPSRARTKEEQDELDEDLQDLQDSDQELSEPRARTRGGPVTTQRDKTREHLQLLKRRRAGEKVPRVHDSDEDSDKGPEGVDIDFIGQPAYDIWSDRSSDSVRASDQSGDNNGDTEQGEDDDFVVDDSRGRLGRPHPDIPLQFTSFASAKPRDLFPHIIEWMVKNKIAPAFNREDPVYNLAFDRVDDQVKAQAGSRLISAAWSTDFKRAILARPTLQVVALPGEDDEHMRTCDACNRTNNPARYEFVFSGEPYYKKTLEPVDNSESDEDADDENGSFTYDEHGHVISSSQTRFYLGRFCAANAEMGHKLTHWKHHLNESLMTYLEAQGVLSAESIVAREKMNKKKREQEAENIVDSMEQTGVIGEFWREFENDLNDARLGMEDFEKRGGRSRGRVGAIRVTTDGMVREWDKDKYWVAKAMESDSEGG
ncbi:uncharacterized protein Z519_11526 [Cladophialophora bantiana CBS 173.52]|uniref:DUF4211 domain-containing protein n=1 Tax=Cladophialophora bantiana (strain ATCC 10958 / CBS 173.52 / CDC B-1940 / NIH 8579) TaxID=1442370 RepID=A0A0D2ECT2_CLAB1|nr:uncharacterized protein Z519_11526 [Cladophialophora bantiana CBS 173.52]KIW87941.1 hypothetical protein Z519_11526 [Cladophialophora bantiana CBS 173.52]